ncbi:MAG TPA: bifunctional nicotinamidase/pyrazinamidase [Chitinophagaceae bacterium]|jgi:nicotinamidase/pyrazinamidase
MKALLLIDIQNDFLPGGALPVPNGDKIIPVVNKLQDSFELVVATQDWHPKNHKSFASNHEGKKPFEIVKLDGLEQTLWPDHCVQGAPGAEFSRNLNTNRVEVIFRKGTEPGIDSYSGFYDNGHRKSTGLAGYLRERKVTEVYVTGLAGDICVYFTAMDSLKENFKTYIVEEAIRSLDDRNFQLLSGQFVADGGRLIRSAREISY